MNRLLASSLSALNIIYAVLIVLTGIVMGYASGAQSPSGGGAGAVLGAIGGVLVASMLCGLVAFLTLIERHLSHLADCADYQNKLMKLDAEKKS